MESIILCNFNCLVAISFSKLLHDKLHSAYQTHLGEKSSFSCTCLADSCKFVEKTGIGRFCGFVSCFLFPFHPRLCSGERWALLSFFHADRFLTVSVCNLSPFHWILFPCFWNSWPLWPVICRWPQWSQLSVNHGMAISPSWYIHWLWYSQKCKKFKY